MPNAIESNSLFDKTQQLESFRKYFNHRIETTATGKTNDLNFGCGRNGNKERIPVLRPKSNGFILDCQFGRQSFKLGKSMNESKV